MDAIKKNSTYSSYATIWFISLSALTPQIAFASSICDMVNVSSSAIIKGIDICNIWQWDASVSIDVDRMVTGQQNFRVLAEESIQKELLVILPPNSNRENSNEKGHIFFEFHINSADERNIF